MTKQLSSDQQRACKLIFGDADFCNNGDEKMAKSNVDHLARAEQILAPFLAKHGAKSKQAGDSHYVPAEPMTGIFATPSETMLKRRQAAAQALTKQRQAEQVESQKQRQTAAAISTMFDTKTVTAGVKNFDYSDAEARRREHSRMVAQSIKDRVFRRL